jgi:hypothetical protein
MKRQDKGISLYYRALQSCSRPWIQYTLCSVYGDRGRRRGRKHTHERERERERERARERERERERDHYRLIKEHDRGRTTGTHEDLSGTRH